ncbi:MAG: YidE/YbjL duplication, partial [Thermovirgaceae bacterium]|nr:YidE/YbjL duplication [Thermovirgaceae bacterium]
MDLTGFVHTLAGNPVFFLSVAVIAGILLGKIKIWGIGLGNSGALFSGLVMGWLGVKVPADYFIWNLLIFVAAVGLLS